ncbi:MAG: PEP-CTERM sorting domain-containing protein [Kiloniellaceae bacterium]|nr:PEP-CTERM sorting domain-containing protein [Kiloniellaceae bacterium]
MTAADQLSIRVHRPKTSFFVLRLIRDPGLRAPRCQIWLQSTLLCSDSLRVACATTPAVATAIPRNSDTRQIFLQFRPFVRFRMAADGRGGNHWFPEGNQKAIGGLAVPPIGRIITILTQTKSQISQAIGIMRFSYLACRLLYSWENIALLLFEKFAQSSARSGGKPDRASETRVLKRGATKMAKSLLLSFRLTVFAAALLCATLASTAAHAVLIEISGASFTPGSGYGDDGSESASSTLLEVAFSTSTFAAQSFSLNSVGQSQTFNFGTINLQEPSSGGGIVGGETDDLGVIANFIFTSPLGMTQMVNAVGTATTGSVSDTHVDYTLAWSPILVDFGIGGQLQISLLELSFFGQDILTQTATITLFELPRTVITTIPEPGTLFLFAIGLIGLATLALRRRA